MDIEQFLEEYKNIDLTSIDREQQEMFRKILFDNGMFEDSLELSKIIYEQNREDDEAIEGYVHNLMYLNNKDEALFVLYNAPKTAPILYLEGIIYKFDELYEIAEDKFNQSRAMTTNKQAWLNIDKELVNIYMETGRADQAHSISERIFHDEPNLENFRLAFDNLFMLGMFEELIDFYKKYGRDYEDANMLFAVSYAHNQLHDIENSKKYLLDTIASDIDFVEAYLHLGHMSKGDEAIKYLEKYVELQGMSTSAYLHLISLYADKKDYDSIRTLMQNVLMNMGISEETLYIAISALKELYEYDKIYEIYNENPEIKDDPNLLAFTLSVLSEEEDYIDFVEQEAISYFDLLVDEQVYYETLKNVYELTGNAQIFSMLHTIEHRQGIPHNH